MTLFSSLTNRIFFASALLAVLTIGVAVYRVNVAVTAQAESELRRGVEEAGTLLEQVPQHAVRTLHPRGPPHCRRDQPEGGNGYEGPGYASSPLRRSISTGLNPTCSWSPGRRDRSSRAPGGSRCRADNAAENEAIRRACTGKEALSLWTHSGGIVQVATVPSFLAGELMGAVSVGFSLDQEAAARFKALTNSEVAIAVRRPDSGIDAAE